MTLKQVEPVDLPNSDVDVRVWAGMVVVCWKTDNTVKESYTEDQARALLEWLKRVCE